MGVVMVMMVVCVRSGHVESVDGVYVEAGFFSCKAGFQWYVR
jgi:hypothetical protein